MNEAERSKSFRDLKALVHPDKHPVDSAGVVTSLFQAVQTFYDKCFLALALDQTHGRQSTKRQRGSPSSVHPMPFHVKDKWTFLNDVNVPTLSRAATDHAWIARTVAFRCINMRGAIIHGNCIESAFNCGTVSSTTYKSVKDVFNAYGGFKVLSSPDAIKEEILNRGPVVSISFVLTKAFLDASPHSGEFAVSQTDRVHPIVIVGWKYTAYGEVFLARSIDGPKSDIPISVGQFSIDVECLAPTDTFEKMAWQDPAKAIDLHLNHMEPGWYDYRELMFTLDSPHLERLAKVLDCSFVASIVEKKRFVVRNMDKIARSRSAYLKDVIWMEDTKLWKVTAGFEMD